MRDWKFWIYFLLIVGAVFLYQSLKYVWCIQAGGTHGECRIELFMRCMCRGE